MNSKRINIRIQARPQAWTLSSVPGGCTKRSSIRGGDTTPSEVNVIQAVPETIAQLGLNGQVLPGLNDINLPDAEPAPEYLRIGVRHEIIKRLQQRLMDLGFMDNDEPTDYFGEMTQQAVKHFQRQNELPTDGIVGNVTLGCHYVSGCQSIMRFQGNPGDDIERIQRCLYELGYLATADLVTGNFGDSTECDVQSSRRSMDWSRMERWDRGPSTCCTAMRLNLTSFSYGEKSMWSWPARSVLGIGISDHYPGRGLR
ncbi:MAG: peptidoglycan-binding domain-containing protein [Enterocloster bolteae]